MVYYPAPVDPRDDPFQRAFLSTPRRVLGTLIHCRSLESTNAFAKDAAAKTDAEGVVVLADRQTGGVGRHGRTWFSPPGGLYVSLLLRPATLPTQQTPLITLTTGVAVAQTLQRMYQLRPALKWPNDILIENRKVAGILCEQGLTGNRVDYTIVGIGINANTPLEAFPKELQVGSTTLRSHVKKTVKLPNLLGGLIETWETWYSQLCKDGFSSIIPHWRRLCSHLQQTVAVTLRNETITGISEDVAGDGTLILRTSTGRVRIRAGDVTQVQFFPTA
jgi:BirA family biotin operon repressor/biotin-[acetyl-CoA-carboxylase] ligase